MATLAKQGNEVCRYLARRKGFGFGLISVRDNGTVLHRGLYSGWKLAGRKKADIPLAEWIEAKRRFYAGLPEWQRAKSLPSQRQLERWVSDSVCETPSGDTVEPDGRGPDGAPSWLLLFGLI